MRELGPVDAFIAGAVGEPGERTFLLQVVQGENRLSFVLEKGQVEALAEQAIALLDEVGLADAGAALAPTEPWFPDDIGFRVGAMQLGYAEAGQVVTLLLVPTDDDTEPVSFQLDPAQLDVAARGGLEAVAAGRPKCPRCGLAMDRDGHHCPATNGDLRGYRP